MNIFTIHSGVGTFAAHTRVDAIAKWSELRTFTWASVKDGNGTWVATADGRVW
ncbi:hypothetical protein FHT44_005105 [Mycolicibacterium sp. BK634]|nr:hypothetical protein [Mycolicibacterium sp. BK634]